MPSDPAQVIVNHASFRVQFGASARRTQSPRIARHLSATQDPARMSGAPAAGRRRAVVWSGRSDPDDTGAHRLLQAVRAGAGQHVEDPAADHAGDAGATQVIPRVDLDGGPLDYDDGPATQTLETPLVGAQRGPLPDGTRLLPAMRTVGSAYDEPAYDESAYAPQDFGTGTDGYDDGYGPDGYDDDTDSGRPRSRRRTDDPARHAYFPGRRMNLGVVLLPLRVFLGFISIYAGMGKLCDPVYFDGGERGSMVKWLNTLHPWDVAEPLRQFALAHPVGAGLVIAFLQVLVGVLTVLGCWQRVAAVIGAAPVRRAPGHRQLEERPGLRRARHHLPRRLVPADHRRCAGLLRGRQARGQRLAPARPPLRHLGPAPLRPAPRRRHHLPGRRCDPPRRLRPRRRRTGRRPRGRPRARRVPAQRAARFPAPAGARHPQADDLLPGGVRLAHPGRHQRGVHPLRGLRDHPGRDPRQQRHRHRRRYAEPDPGHHGPGPAAAVHSGGPGAEHHGGTDRRRHLDRRQRRLHRLRRKR
ncbi:putative membrane protein YphA (DoxX/SURF4 family) [Streptomyces collinus]